MRKTLGPLLGLLVLGAVAVAIYFSASKEAFQSHIVEVNGLIGSEKSNFFDDLRVKDRLGELGLVVHYQKAGSRQIDTFYNPADYDFVFLQDCRPPSWFGASIHRANTTRRFSHPWPSPPGNPSQI
jgi:hypothetical protein